MTPDRPRARLTDVSSRLLGFAITTYDVPVPALVRHLPEWLQPVTGEVAGRERAFVSAVSFENTDFYVHFAPFVRLRCFQTNYRAYVRRDGEDAVWFFGTSLGTPFVALPRAAWRLPWHRSRGVTRHEWQGDRAARYDWEQHAPGRFERLVAQGRGEPLAALPGFSDAATTARVLTHPLRGYVRRANGAVATYGVWHEPLRMDVATPSEARYQWFESLGLVERGQAPHSVLVQRETDFLVKLPPRACEARREPNLEAGAGENIASNR